ncbi:hypothetical protein CA54_17140 [Symmachiella macrocystis]|uniref:Uncharacterized protein n=1 Tax=Symmachiella macrocystis TaxID=2527985 RepID=A0A5C6BLG1_9PLAN|nr:hypothetical protein [Symmachiella macrocystis]TWU12888.1 hypothetical protein CA54_17140 [Symmachiella macrocystis]
MLRIHLLTAAFALCTLAGCGETPKPEETSPPANSTEAGHGHSHSHSEGPNGGVIADWGGGKFHVEFTVDHDTKIATVYILDNNAKNPAPIDAEKLLLNIADPVFQVELMPVPLEGEAEGTSSRFIGKNDKLGVVQEFAGTISGEADGTPYAGDFKEETHSH